MACSLVTLDKTPRVRPVGIGETLRQAWAKLVMRVAGDQSKTVCGNLYLCAGLDAGIEGATHAVGQRRIERVRVGWREEEAEALYVEVESGVVVAALGNITIETAGIEYEVAEGLEAALEMEVQEARGGGVEG